MDLSFLSYSSRRQAQSVNIVAIFDQSVQDMFLEVKMGMDVVILYLIMIFL